VLIVFSLFLAFQLNDLNDRNNEKKLRETYTRLLIKDYQTDLEQIRAARTQFLREIQLIVGVFQQTRCNMVAIRLVTKATNKRDQ